MSIATATRTTILWFRRDLRLHDHAALERACASGAALLPIYIHAPGEERPWEPGGASRWWLHHTLAALDRQLQGYGLRLHYFSGSSHGVLSRLIDATGAESLLFNRLYEPHLYARDLELQQRLGNRIRITAFDTGLFFTPGSVLNGQQQAYRVFTPFYKKTRPLLQQRYSDYVLQPPAAGLAGVAGAKVGFDVSLHELGLLDHHPWHEKLHRYWRPGEQNALQLLARFVEGPLADYTSGRDFPALEGTSRLSPCLHFGEITPQQIHVGLQPALHGTLGAQASQAAELFLRQLLWREFAHHVLWHFPHTATQPMNRRYRESFWRMHKEHFSAWSRGVTGIPMVDAGMRQLWQSGWMHNRVRMIVASLLTKNLGINWLHGARWFWDTLVDADLANNTLGWQWVAGCGVDAAPYYRIFNPLTQARRFDPQHAYINAWAPGEGEAGHPAPIVDLAESRRVALQRYKRYLTAQER